MWVIAFLGGGCAGAESRRAQESRSPACSHTGTQWDPTQAAPCATHTQVTCSPLSSSTGSLRRNRRGPSTAAPVLTLLAVPQPLPPVPAVFHVPSLHLLGKLV